MTLTIAIIVLSSIVTGAGAARAALGRVRMDAGSAGLYLAASFGFGAGISSLVYYACKLAAPGATAVLASAELIAAAGAFGVSAAVSRGARHDAAVGPSELSRPVRFLLNAALAFTLIRMLVLFFSTAAAYPYGAADALNVWSFRGLYFAVSGGGWARAFEPVYMTNDFNYPLLLSGFLARCWDYTRGVSVSVPALTGALFTVGSVAVVFGALRLLKRNASPWLAALVLTGTPLFTTMGALQTSDVPLAFYMLLAVALHELHAARGRDAATAVCAGLALGFCAWTKNEGLLFAAIFLCAQFAAGVLTVGMRASVRSTAAVLAGVAVPVLAAFHLYSTFHLRAPVSGGPRDLVRLARVDYLAALAHEFVSVAGNVMQVNWFMAAGFALLPFALAAGLLKRNRRTAGASLAACALLLAGCIAADFIYPYSSTLPGFSSLLRDTLHRFMLQIYPSMIFLTVIIFGAEATRDRRDAG